MFHDLKKAIREVLEDAQYSRHNSKVIPGFTLDMHLVRSKKLKVLQAEFNIHFVEPEDKQLEVITNES